MAFGFQFVQQFNRADFAGFVGSDAFTRVFQHRQCMQRNIGARPSIGRGRQIVRIGFAVHFEHGNGNFFGYFGARSEPFRIRPRFQHGLSVYVAFFSFFLHVVEGIKHQKRVFQAVCRNRRQFFVVQKLNQRMDVVTAQHGAEQFHCFFGRHQRTLHAAFGNGGQERGFHFRRIVHTRRHAVGQQFQQKLALAGRRIFQQFGQFGGLLRSQRQGGNAQGFAFGGGFTVGF